MDYKDYLKFAEKVIAVIPTVKDAEYFGKLVDSIRNAAGLKIDERDEARRLAQLNFNAISLTNQAVFSAFLADTLTDDLEKEFRTLPKAEEVAEALKAETEKAKAEEEELQKQLQAFRERGRTYDLVHAVSAGRSVKEAKKMQEEYDKQASAAMQE